MKLFSIAMFALLFMVIALNNNNNKIECNHLAEMRVSEKTFMCQEIMKPNLLV